jgi:hypothetical protein
MPDMQNVGWPAGPEAMTDGLEASVARHVAQVARVLRPAAAAFTAEIVDRCTREIPAIADDDVQLLSDSVAENVTTALHIMQHGISVEHVQTAVVTTQYARYLARRGTPVHALIEAYQLGHNTMLTAALEQSITQAGDPQLRQAATHYLVALGSAFMNRVIDQVVEAYNAEREVAAGPTPDQCANDVQAVLDGDWAAVANIEDRLGYRLRGAHVGLVLWCLGQPDEGALAALNEMAAGLANRVSCEGTALVVRRDDTSSLAVWLPLDDARSPGREVFQRALAEAKVDARIAVGSPARNLAGFRSTHRQALRIQVLGRAAGDLCPAVVAAEDVGPAALMISDGDPALSWAARTLGDLATDDARHRELRETFHAFLAAGGSYTTAAARLDVHKNTVVNRVRRAEALLGTATGSRLDVELALALCSWVGVAALAGHEFVTEGTSLPTAASGGF